LHRLAPGVLEQVASTQAPQPALAVARIVEPDLDEVLSHADNPLLLVLCDVSDPGNAGTLVRVAEATGATAVVVCGPAAVDVHNPKVVRSTAGSLFRVPVVSIAEAGDALDAMAAHKLTRLATVVDDGEQYDARDWRGPVAIVLGSEAHGLPDDVVASLDGAVAIPMLGGVESLNVAVAGAVLAFEAARQRRAAP
jgi:TrmH family RNA methyltransferase